MITIEKDITTVTEGIICHQANCQGVMGAGLAKQIRRKFPEAYNEYMIQYRRNNLCLGNVIFALISSYPILFVANLCGQDRYGRGGKFTNYRAVRRCLEAVVDFKREYSIKLDSDCLPVYIPDHMGCTLGGGDWNEVLKIIEEVIPNAIIARYNQGAGR